MIKHVTLVNDLALIIRCILTIIQLFSYAMIGSINDSMIGRIISTVIGIMIDAMIDIMI